MATGFAGGISVNGGGLWTEETAATISSLAGVVQFHKTGNGEEVGLIIPQADGSKFIIKFLNGELVTDVSPI